MNIRSIQGWVSWKERLRQEVRCSCFIKTSALQAGGMGKNPKKIWSHVKLRLRLTLVHKLHYSIEAREVAFFPVAVDIWLWATLESSRWDDPLDWGQFPRKRWQLWTIVANSPSSLGMNTLLVKGIIEGHMLSTIVVWMMTPRVLPWTTEWMLLHFFRWRRRKSGKDDPTFYMV